METFVVAISYETRGADETGGWGTDYYKITAGDLDGAKKKAAILLGGLAHTIGLPALLQKRRKSHSHGAFAWSG